MKIGSSGSNISFSNLNIANVAKEEAEEAVKLNPEDSSKSTAEDKSVSSSRRPERLNMMAGSFVHQESESTNYSMRNLKGQQSESNLMRSFNSLVGGLVTDRLSLTSTLIDSGLTVADAKKIASDETLKKGEAAHKNLIDQIAEENLEEESKEIKEDTETRTEEVVEKKQEEKKTEAKEAEAKDNEAKTDPDNADAKVSESNPETVNPAQTVQSGVETGSTESIASGSVGVEAGASTAKGAASGNADSSSTGAGTSKKVDVVV